MSGVTFQGRVVRGEGMATRLGCPTANIAIEQGLVIPGAGLYVGMTGMEGVNYPSLVCINDGRTGHNLKMEVHLIGVQKNLDGKYLRITLLEKLRDLVAFESEEFMKKLIEQDLIKTRAWFLEHGYELPNQTDRQAEAA